MCRKLVQLIQHLVHSTVHSKQIVTRNNDAEKLKGMYFRLFRVLGLSDESRNSSLLAIDFIRKQPFKSRRFLVFRKENQSRSIIGNGRVRIAADFARSVNNEIDQLILKAQRLYLTLSWHTGRRRNAINFEMQTYTLGVTRFSLSSFSLPTLSLFLSDTRKPSSSATFLVLLIFVRFCFAFLRCVGIFQRILTVHRSSLYRGALLKIDYRCSAEYANQRATQK